MKARRLYLTPREMQAMLSEQNGRCFKCKGEGPDFIAEHSVPVALGNDQKPDCLLCADCARKKTYGLRGDISNIAKVKRIRNGKTQHDKRLEHGSRIKGRGFQGWRGFDGSIRTRSKER